MIRFLLQMELPVDARLQMEQADKPDMLRTSLLKKLKLKSKPADYLFRITIPRFS